MNKILISIVVFYFVGISSYGQAPTWSVNENDFEHTMSFVAFLNIDGNTLSSTSDKVAAFVNGECRGVTNLIYEQSKQRYYAYLNVFSNNNGETLSFKVYDSSNDNVIEISKTVDFDIDALHGNVLQAFSFANPVLNSGAEIISFEFVDTPIINRTIVNNEMTLYVENGQDLSALNTLFQISDGAKLSSQTIELESGNNALDFSASKVLEILSEDESQRVEWTVSVNYTSAIANIAYYKKDAVCYTGGAIKIIGPNLSNVELYKDQVFFVSQTINNGEAVFVNLEAGNYLAKISGLEKEIVINLKD